MLNRLPLIVLLSCVSFLDIPRTLAENRDSADIVKEIGKLALPGMPVAEAVANLKKAGYRCGKSELAIDDPNATLCSRQRSYRVMASCISQVLLVPASNGNVVERLDIREPKCAGL